MSADCTGSLFQRLQESKLKSVPKILYIDCFQGALISNNGLRTSIISNHFYALRIIICKCSQEKKKKKKPPPQQPLSFAENLCSSTLNIIHSGLLTNMPGSFSSLGRICTVYMALTDLFASQNSLLKTSQYSESCASRKVIITYRSYLSSTTSSKAVSTHISCVVTMTKCEVLYQFDIYRQIKPDSEEVLGYRAQ